MKKDDTHDRSETEYRCLSEEVGARQADRQDTVGEVLYCRRVGSAREQRPATQEINQDRAS